VNPKNFFAELKRRNVYKVAVAYAVVGWLVMQVASTVVPALHLPEAVTTAVVVLTLLGFPIALVVAWAFELTPEGIKRTEDADLSQPHSHAGAWIYIAIFGAALSVALFFVGRYTAPARSEAKTNLPEKSVAVLPFDNLSRDPDNAYFADGIQDQILTRLAKIADLKVTSQISTQKYKSTPNSLSEIAQHLGVTHVLKGSVQKAAEQVRVSVQLINCVNDSHLWAETYDRKLSDVFQVESDVAQKIAASLEAKLTGREMREITAGGTKNPEAFDAYLRARALVNKQGAGRLDKMIQFCRRAVDLDPNYAEAWATLATAEAEKYFVPETTQMQLERARDAAKTALRLAPDLADAHAAMGLFYYYCLQDFDGALAELTVAHERAPNDANILLAIGLVKRRQGKLDDSIEVQHQSAKLDPLNEDIWVNLGGSYRGKRKFDEARSMFDHALTIAPDDVAILAQKAETYLAQGDLDTASQLLSGLKSLITGRAFPIQIGLLVYKRQFDEASAQISSATATPNNTPPLFVAVGHAILGHLHVAKGDRVKAQSLFVQAEQELKSLRTGGDHSFLLTNTLVQVEARLGHRDEVESDADSIRQRIKKDAWGFGREEEAVARAYTILGELDRALPLLEHALAAPTNASLTPAMLRLDPFWDSVRNDPRFQKLCQDKAK
jgi:TolB-like protein/Tfp pilus assembly protein PilF